MGKEQHKLRIIRSGWRFVQCFPVKQKQNIFAVLTKAKGESKTNFLRTFWGTLGFVARNYLTLNRAHIIRTSPQFTVDAQLIQEHQKKVKKTKKRSG